MVGWLEGCARSVREVKPMMRWLLGSGLASMLTIATGAVLAGGSRAPIADVPLVDTPNLEAGDRKRGERYFNERIYASCSVCHTLVKNRKWIGPSLHGIFGRKAGTMENFVYSKAMRESGIVWDAESIDQWIQNPRAFVPGTRMYFKGLPGPQHAQIRRDIIAFLKEATR
jgi:cytochrome c